jgi:hypothetical protein
VLTGSSGQLYERQAKRGNAGSGRDKAKRSHLMKRIAD